MPRPTTNNDLLREIKSVQNTVQSIDGRVSTLETWRVAEDAARAAVEHYKEELLSKDRRRLVTTIGAFLAALTLLAYAIIQSLHR